MSDTPDLSRALVDSLRSEDLRALAGEYAEIGLDELLTDGVLKDVPVVNTVRALAKIGLAVRDRLLIQKLVRFLGPLHDIDPALRREVIDKLEGDPDYGRNIGEHLVQLLERIDAHLKPEMLARTFKAYALGQINAEMFHRLNHAIEHLPWFAFPLVRKFYDMPPKERTKLSENAKNDLALAGLAIPASGWGALVYQYSPVCEAFLKLELDRVGA